MYATVRNKGQVTIPASIREKMGIKPQDRVDFVIDGDELKVKRVKTLRDFKGAVPPRPGADEQVELEAAKAFVVSKVIEGMS